MVVVIVFFFGVLFEFIMLLGMFNLNFVYWWGEDIGWKLGLLDWLYFIVVLFFVVLVVFMWLLDFLGY